MSDNYQKSDNAVREKLNNFEISPPEFVWTNIQGQLLENRKNKKIIFFRIASVAAVLLFALTAGLYYLTLERPVTHLPETTSQLEVPSDPNHIAIEKNSIQKAPENQFIVSNKSPNLQPVQKRIPVNKVLATQPTAVSNLDFKGNEIELKIMENRKAHVRFNDGVSEKLILVARNTLTNNDLVLIAHNLETSASKGKETKNWKIGMFVSPGYSSHSASYSENYKQTMTGSGNKGSENVGGGVSFQYKLLKKLGIETGIFYAQNGQKNVNQHYLAFSNANALYFGDYLTDKAYNNVVNFSGSNLVMNSQAGKIEMASIPSGTEIQATFDNNLTASTKNLAFNGDFSQVFSFMEMPFLVKYNILEKKPTIQIIGGVNAGIVVGNTAYITNGNYVQKVGKTQDISALNVAGIVGVGMSYPLTSNLSLAVEPRFSYYLNSINKSNELEFRPYRISIFSGLNYEF